MPTSILFGDHGNVRSSKKPTFSTSLGYTTLENTRPIRNGSHVHDGHLQRFQDSNERRD